jgi:hypothetical protein
LDDGRLWSSAGRKPTKLEAGHLVVDPVGIEALTLFVLYTGIGWADLPQELGFGAGIACSEGYETGSPMGCSTASNQALLVEQNAAGHAGSPRRWWTAAISASTHVRTDTATRVISHTGVAADRIAHP